jgi:hypothetical protein
MIHQIMIITDSGISIFNHEFSDMKIEPVLFGGFTTALNNFSREIIEMEQNIESIKMSRLKLIISNFKNFNLVLVINKYDEIAIFQSLIIELQNIFLEMYGHLNESDLNCISNFDSFHPIAAKLGHSHIDIGIISSQSQIKKDYWNFLQQLDGCVLPHTKMIQNWNTLQFVLDKISNCDITLWNIDLEHNIEYFNQIVNDKPILFLLIEPNLKKIFDFIPLINVLKQNKKEIYGIIIKNYGKILSSNCEVILKIPIFELDVQSIEDKSLFKQYVGEIVQGRIG